MLPLWESGPGSDPNERLIHIPEISSITGALQSDYLIAYTRHWLAGSYPSAEMHSVYSTAPADWA